MSVRVSVISSVLAAVLTTLLFPCGTFANSAPSVQVAQAVLPDWAKGLSGAMSGGAKPADDKSAAESAGTAAGESTAPNSPAAGGAAASTEADKAAEALLPTAVGAPLEPVLQPVRRISGLLDDLEKTVERVKDRDEELARARGEIDKLPPEARRAIDAIQPRLADIRAQIDKLGPAPKGEEPPESAEVAAERQRLNGLASQLDGAIKSADLVAVRSRQLIDRVQELRQSIFAKQVLRRTKHSPLKPSLWNTVLGELPGAGSEIVAIARGWWASASPRLTELTAIFSVTALIYLGLRLLRRSLLVARLDRPADATPLRFFERAAAASWVAPAIGVPAVAAALFLYVALESSDMLYLQTDRFAQVLLKAILIVVIVGALARAILQPRWSAWRLLDLSDASARRLTMLTRLAALVYGIDLVLRDLIKMLYLPFQVNVAQAFVFSMLFAWLMFALARTPLTPRGSLLADTASTAEVSKWEPLWLKAPLMLVALVIAGVSLAGYVALGRYISSQVVLTGTAVVAIALLHLAIRAISGDPKVAGDSVENSVGARLLVGRLRLDEAQQRQMDRIVYATLNVVLAFVSVPLLLAIWDFSTPEIISFARSAVFGFDIGGIHISPTRILLAIGLFVLLLFATRLVQRWLLATVLQPSRIDSGLANSIHTGVGYAGFALAALAAVSYGGLDITNLAIVAGALSVGIGFGLQSIVNNFVSGLILLVERPIKVGDWIAVGEFEGHVRRISVRSTEIETFDRSSVIVPNSALISGTVKNRTHRNALGRIDVVIGVAYDSDPEVVKALLEKVANDSPMVLKFPAPIVSFDNFAASSLDFTVRAFVADVNKSISTATDVRLRIFKALKAAGIEIPFPQQDVHLRDLDFVKTTVARFAAERMAKAAAEKATGSRESDVEQEDGNEQERSPRNLRTV